MSNLLLFFLQIVEEDEGWKEKFYPCLFMHPDSSSTDPVCDMAASDFSLLYPCLFMHPDSSSTDPVCDMVLSKKSGKRRLPMFIYASGFFVYRPSM
jgi:hypothetical protein